MSLHHTLYRSCGKTANWLRERRIQPRPSQTAPFSLTGIHLRRSFLSSASHGLRHPATLPQTEALSAASTDDSAVRLRTYSGVASVPGPSSSFQRVEANGNRRPIAPSLNGGRKPDLARSRGGEQNSSFSSGRPPPPKGSSPSRVRMILPHSHPASAAPARPTPSMLERLHCSPRASALHSRR